MDFSKSLVEVDEILNYLSPDNLMKIPSDIREIIKENKDLSYTWSYDVSKPLKKQSLSDEAISIISYLNMEYLLNAKQKKIMGEIYDLTDQKIEEEKSKKYSPDMLFYQNNNVHHEVQNNSNTELTVYKENLFLRFLNKIKSFLFK